MHPGRQPAAISVNLKDVTIAEALDAIRELYGYDYRIDGTRIFVQPAGLQTRVFQVNYLPGQRRGLSDLRVQSGAVSDVDAAGGAPAAPPTAPGAAATSRSLESSRVRTEQQTDFWVDLRAALVAIVGTGEGRSVVVSPQSGVVVVRALPGGAARGRAATCARRALAVERQVMLEAKIVEVTLVRARYQSGINWARSAPAAASIGQVASGHHARRARREHPPGDRRADRRQRRRRDARRSRRAAIAGATCQPRDRRRRRVRPRAADRQLRRAAARSSRRRATCRCCPARASPRSTTRRRCSRSAPTSSSSPTYRPRAPPPAAATHDHRRRSRCSRSSPASCSTSRRRSTRTATSSCTSIPSVSEVTESTRVVNLGGSSATDHACRSRRAR